MRPDLSPRFIAVAASEIHGRVMRGIYHWTVDRQPSTFVNIL
jgi:hypothetical protein